MRPMIAVAVGAAALVSACESADPPEVELDAVVADPGHYSVEFENDAVRVLRIEYGPAETSVMHGHPATCSVALTDAAWRMTDPDGEVTEDTAEMGDVECGDEATVHLPENTGSQPSELILVELKEGAAAGTAAPPEHPDAVTADSDHYSVEFENEAVRIVQVHYDAGETSVMHHHPANCAIFVRMDAATFEDPSGEVIEAPVADPGSVQCNDAQVHLPTNTGEGQVDVVLVEFKGRDALGR